MRKILIVVALCFGCASMKASEYKAWGVQWNACKQVCEDSGVIAVGVTEHGVERPAGDLACYCGNKERKVIPATPLTYYDVPKKNEQEQPKNVQEQPKP